MAHSSLIRSIFLLFSLGAVLLIYGWGYGPFIGIDDAHIYFVYMRNFADGHGFVWNIGGERVEGFTSLIWTLTGALVYWIWPSGLNNILLVLNFCLVAVSLHSLLSFSRQLNGTKDSPLTVEDVLIVALLLMPLGFVEWGIIALMETGLWVFLITHLSLQIAYFFIDRRAFNLPGFSMMIVLLDLTRPESLVMGFVFITVLLFAMRAENSTRLALKAGGVLTGLHLLTSASVIAWRLDYFGYFFPNTFYAKVSGSLIDNLYEGGRYLMRFFYSYPHAAVALSLLGLYFIVFLKRSAVKDQPVTKNEKVLVALLAIIIAGLAIPVFTGGDHFKYSRFFQPYLPLIYLLATARYFWHEYMGLSLVQQQVRPIVMVMPVVFGILFFSKFTVFDFLKPRTSVNYNLLSDFALAQNAQRLGENLNETFGAVNYPSLGALATGSIAYNYKGKTIDLLGLNNTTMAHANRIKEGYRNHASFDKAGFWKLNPDMLGTFMGADIVRDTSLFVLPENTSRYRTSDFTYLCYKGIFDDPDFREAYAPALVQRKTKNYFIFAYYKRSLLASLDSSDYFVRSFSRKPAPQGSRSLHHLVTSGRTGK